MILKKNFSLLIDLYKIYLYFFKVDKNINILDRFYQDISFLIKF